ncbi:MAG: hypothetical protein IH585_12370, partial [Anaerolineaceae bacterium]|nr:hypothetical protein [Anaerolineaceae bacterium]
MKQSLKFVRMTPAILLWSLPFAFLLIFYFQPLVANFKVAWQATTPEVFASMSWKVITQPLFFTIWQAILSTLLTVIVGF